MKCHFCDDFLPDDQYSNICDKCLGRKEKTRRKSCHVCNHLEEKTVPICITCYKQCFEFLG